MKILIINRWDDDHQSDYGSRIDHDRHQVSYVTVPKHLPRIPDAARHIEVVPDLADPAPVISAAEAAHRAVGPFDTLLALSEFDLLTGAVVRERLGIPGPDTEAVTVFRDKARMKERVAAGGLRVPQFREVTGVAQVAEFRAALGAPVVVKPRAGAASVGTFVVRPDEDLDAVLAGTDLSDYEVEEFVEGPVWHVDGLMDERAMIFGRASRYMDTCYGFSQGRPLGSAVHTGPEAEEMLAFTEACLQALGLDRGAFHFELIQTRTGPVFLEVGARFGGGEIPWVFQDVYGVDLIGDWIRLELGEPVRTVPAGDRPDAEHGGFLLVPEPRGTRLVSRPSMTGTVPHLYAEELPAAGHLFDGKGGYRFILGRFRYRGPSPEAVEEAIRTTIEGYRCRLEELEPEDAPSGLRADRQVLTASAGRSR
ncbi:ATP-grasp domain-containing protein [Streptacidiphilus rugosus]|uniref:ATP-grasp domain-containing protein n=1 Tax=Streptacidiphilus rugosus TaxID=405783 RepID=UPI00069128A4|nr:ATP-grasp domain-containing protein [Streptacidiphilus rugosus]